MNNFIEKVMNGVDNYHHVKLRKPSKDGADYTVYTTDTEYRGGDEVLGIRDLTMSIEIYSESTNITKSERTIAKNLTDMAIGFDINAVVYIEPDKRYMTLITFTHTHKGGYEE